MHALMEEFPVEDAVMRLEPRVARIEADVGQLNSRHAVVEIDLRDLRKSMDQKLDEADARFDRSEARLDAAFAKLEARIDRLDAKFESKLEALSTRRFTLWLVLISSTATIAAGVLTIIFGGSHGH